MLFDFWKKEIEYECRWNGNEYVNDMKINQNFFLSKWNGIEIKRNDNENEMTTN